MISYLQSQDFQNNPPELVIWEFPERYLAQPQESAVVNRWFENREPLLAAVPKRRSGSGHQNVTGPDSAAHQN
jgi:alginate O-acetyltransferase complex protein AlgJ